MFLTAVDPRRRFEFEVSQISVLSSHALRGRMALGSFSFPSINYPLRTFRHYDSVSHYHYFGLLTIDCDQFQDRIAVGMAARIEATSGANYTVRSPEPCELQ